MAFSLILRPSSFSQGEAVSAVNPADPLVSVVYNII
jgi:hypothetical protein